MMTPTQQHPKVGMLLARIYFVGMLVCSVVSLFLRERTNALMFVGWAGCAQALWPRALRGRGGASGREGICRQHSEPTI